MTKRDIQSREDLEIFLRGFYEEAMKDDLLSEKFAGMDLESHMPTIIDFWQMLTIGGATYKGRPFDVHMGRQLRKEHFERWLTLFQQQLLLRNDGSVSRQVLQQARQIAAVFQHKLHTLESS
ncbi:MAG: group III truncated hemoglobin [Lentisphaeria bacterium]|nr:group III truncated hemoglobin [Lentisphaeria bacterium]